MRIAIIGAGNLGTALARRLKSAGHDVVLSFAQDAAKLAADAARLGVGTATPAQAAAGSEVVALVVPWAAVDAALAALGPLDGKILWDCTNALRPDFSGLAVGTDTSGAEIIAAKVPGARVVKGIPPFAELLHAADPTLAGKAAGSFLCGDDGAAKTVVRGLLEALPATVVDAGPLSSARFAEPAGMLLVRLAYGLGYGARIGLDLISD